MTFYTQVRQWGNDLLFLGYDGFGNRIKDRIEDYAPSLYLPCPEDSVPSFFTSYDGIPLAEIKFTDIKDAKEFIKNSSGVSNVSLFGIDRFNYSYIAEQYHDVINYVMGFLRVHVLDIETYSGDGYAKPENPFAKVTVITIYDTKTKKYYVWGEEGGEGGNYVPHLNNVVYFSFKNEIELLKEFLTWFKMNHPDILTGWYSRGYDVPYLINRVKKVLGDKWVKCFSPWEIVQKKTSQVKRFGSAVTVESYDMYGIAELDYMDLYQKYNMQNQSSFSLNHIAEIELDEKKLDYEGTLHDLYTSDYQKYVEYNIQDVGLVYRIDQKKRFLDLIVDVAYSGKVPMYNDCLGTVKYWETLIYNYLYENKRLIPLKSRADVDGADFEGGYVKEPKTGMYEYAVSFDLESLYPRIIEQVNIGVETQILDFPDDIALMLSDVSVQALVHKQVDLSALKLHNYSMAGNGQIYSKTSQSFLAELMGKFFAKRKEFKLTMQKFEKEYEATKSPEANDNAKIYDIKQQATKILINSAYGAVGNQYFQFYNYHNAQAVTLTGQVVIQWIEKRLNARMNELLGTSGKDYVIAIDTDSVYMDFSEIVKRMGLGEDKLKTVNFLDKLCKTEIKKLLDSSFDELGDYLNSMRNLMNMKREVISEKAVWTGKKRYFMNIWDKEGTRYEKPKMKIMGLEVVKSNVPQFSRDALRECCSIIMNKDNAALLTYLEQVKKDFYKLPAKDMATPKGVSDIESYFDRTTLYKKGCPIHCRGAILYNHLIDKHDLGLKYQKLTSGSKMKYIYLKMPNSIHEDVIGFIDKLPPEFGLDKYIDFKLQYEKNFLSYLRLITEKIGWKTEDLGDLSSFFGSDE